MTVDKVLAFLEAHRDGFGEKELRDNGDRQVLQILLEERKNLIHWIPFANQRVLEVGALCGTYTRELLAQGATVDVLETEDACRNLLEVRFLDEINLLADAAALWELEQPAYDWILLVDGMENPTIRSLAQAVEDGVTDAGVQLTALLRKLQGLLAATGRILLVTDNRMGMKYFSATGQETIPFGQFAQNYGPKGQTRFTYGELQQVFAAADMTATFYYPYPDAIFPEYIYSQEHLPDGEEYMNSGLAWHEGVRLFHEHGAFATVMQEGLFAQFASSYLCVLQQNPGLPADLPTYVKYSTRRHPRFAISTELFEKADGDNVVQKRAFFPEGATHIQHMITLQKDIAGAVSNTKFLPCMCHATADPTVLVFDFAPGESFESILDAHVFAGELDKAYALMQKFFDELSRAAKRPFQVTEEFQKIFLGQLQWPDLIDVSLPVTDIDLIFANVICQQDKWWIIDYEWTFGCPIPFRFLIYRILFYYLYANPKRREILTDDVYHHFGLEPEEMALYEQMEAAFQSYIFGGYLPLYQEDGCGNVLPPVGENSVFAAEVYEDFGDGFQPDSRRSIPSLAQDGLHHLVIDVSKHTQCLRIDPAAVPGVLTMVSVTDQSGQPLEYACNSAKDVGTHQHLFVDQDPNVMVYLPPEVTQVVAIYYYDGWMQLDESCGAVLPVHAGNGVSQRMLAFAEVIGADGNLRFIAKVHQGLSKIRRKRLLRRVRRLHRKAR